MQHEYSSGAQATIDGRVRSQVGCRKQHEIFIHVLSSAASQETLGHAAPPPSGRDCRNLGGKLHSLSIVRNLLFYKLMFLLHTRHMYFTNWCVVGVCVYSYACIDMCANVCIGVTLLNDVFAHICIYDKKSYIIFLFDNQCISSYVPKKLK